MANPPNGFDPLKGINLQQPTYPVQVPMRFGYKRDMNHGDPTATPKQQAILVNPNNSVFANDVLMGDNNKPLFTPQGGLTTDYSKPTALPRLLTSFDKPSLSLPTSNGMGDSQLVQQASASAQKRADLDEQSQTRPVQPLGLPRTTITQPTAQGAYIDPITNKPTAVPTLQPTNATQEVPYSLYQNPNPITQGTDMGARDYFNLIKGIDSGALINNMMQAPPPNIQMPLTHLQRVQLDRGQIDNMAEQTREQQAAAFRNLRENVTQASDFMRGVEAINKSSAEGQRQVGAEYANMNNQEMQMNNQIANQEQQTQDAQNLQEQMTNYELQAKAKAEKNAAITSNLTEIKKDSMAEAQYNIMQQDQMRQQSYDKDYIDRDTNLKLLQMKREASSDYQNKPEYNAERKQHMQSSLEQYHNDLVKGTPFENTKWQDMAMAEDTQKNLAERLSMGQKMKAEITRLDAAKAAAKTDEEKNAIDEQRAKYSAEYDKYEKAAPEIQKMHDDYDKYVKGRNEKYNVSGLQTQFDAEYRKKNKIMTTAEYMQEVENMARGKAK